MFWPTIVHIGKYVMGVLTLVLLGVYLQSLVIVRIAPGVLGLILTLLTIIVILLAVLDTHYTGPVK